MEIDERIGRIESSLVAIKTTLWGAQGDNGMNATVKVLRAEFDGYVDNHPSICVGKKALDTYVEQIKEREGNMITKQHLDETMRHNRIWAVLTFLGVVAVPIILKYL